MEDEKKQVLISFTLNLTKEMSIEELNKYLEDNCPMEIKKNQPFAVSTERWDICSNK